MKKKLSLILIAVFTFNISICTAQDIQSTESKDSVSACSDKIYTVGKGILLDAAVGQADRPATVPECVEGVDALKDYYRLHPIKDGRGAGMIFKVSVAFLVNCNGEIVEYKLLTSHPGKTMSELADKVLNAVREAPLHWKAATDAEDNTIDCWQVLDFTVVESSLAKCSYVQ